MMAATRRTPISSSRQNVPTAMSLHQLHHQLWLCVVHILRLLHCGLDLAWRHLNLRASSAASRAALFHFGSRCSAEAVDLAAASARSRFPKCLNLRLPLGQSVFFSLSAVSASSVMTASANCSTWPPMGRSDAATSKTLGARSAPLIRASPLQ